MAIAFSAALLFAIPLGLMMGRTAPGGLVLQSAADDHLSGAEGGADADHHAVARRRRSRKNAGDLSRRQPARDLSQLSGRQGGRGKDAVVGRRDGPLGAAAHDPDRAAGGLAGNPHGMPHRPGAGADHHGHLGDDRAAVRRRQHPVQRARHGAVRHRLRHDHHHRRDGDRPRRRVRKICAAGWCDGPSPASTFP